MDLEAGKDDLSFEDGKLVVFSQVYYTIDEPKRTCWRSKTKDAGGGQVILTNACGALRPGRLTFILGPSGAGKTTLMKILAGRKNTGVSGSVVGAGRSAVFVAQHATLIDSLTAKETLQFAASLKLPDASPRDRQHVIEAVSKQLGINEVLNTRAGKLSGGERKRLTIATELLTDPTILLLDEPTSGLDSVSSMSVARALRTVAAGGRTVACVIHQPSSKLFASADDVILLASGKTLYAGAAVDLPASLARAGFVCPQYYNMADYLLEVATYEHSGNLAIMEAEAASFANEMKEIVGNDVLDKNGKVRSLSHRMSDLIEPYSWKGRNQASNKRRPQGGAVPKILDATSEAEALLSKRPQQQNEYKASVCQQLGVLLWRGFIGAVRDVHLTQIRLVAHLLVALLLGALYNGAGEEASRIFSNTGCIFFFLLFLFFSNAMPTIHTFPVEATVVLQEHLNRWYSLPAYCASKIIVDLPTQLLCATLFVFPAWYFTSQPLDVHRMGLAWLICILVTILAQTFGLVIGAACGVKLGLFVIPAANIPMLMFSEFFIPYREMPVYLRPFAVISYFRYAFNGLLQTVYGFDRERLPCHDVIGYCMFRDPATYLDHLGLTHKYMIDIWALLIWIWILQIALICVLRFRVYKACR